MMLAWGLDMDTHSHFRRYLDVFINKRRVSKNLKAFAMDPSARIYLQNWYANAGYGMFNELRVSLPNRVMGGGDHSIITYKFTHLSIPVLIEELHPPRLQHGTTCEQESDETRSHLGR